MISRQDMRQLLKQQLSGKEAARIVLLDSVEVDHGRPGLLTEKELERLKKSLPVEEIPTYNAWMYVYQMVGYSLLEAKTLYLEASLHLEYFQKVTLIFLATREAPWPVKETVARAARDYPEHFGEMGLWAEALLPELEKEGVTVAQAIHRASVQAREEIRKLKAYKKVLEEVSSLIEVRLTEDFESWLEMLARYVLSHNMMTGAKIETEDGQTISLIRLTMLKPDSKTVAYLRDRIAMALGDGWWKEDGHG